ncbi:PLP-dependent aminotransferase family protein [Candidatus Bipolaricaulota bacterium]|nr:PLP-dependent aminotransferase family protein [Candidatus Bipolaricaulota bacterium]
MNSDRYYSTKAQKMESSKIREISKIIAERDIISLAGGMPSPSSFPIEIVSELSEQLLKEKGAEALQYGTTTGYRKLKEVIARRLNENFDMSVNGENILVTSGAQQALYLVGKVFVERDDEVVVEAPTYASMLQILQELGGDVSDIELEKDGFAVDKFKKYLENGGNPKLSYFVPTFQNPSGITTSLRKRQKLVDLAEAHDFLIVEDDPYHQLRYSGGSVPPIYSVDDNNRTIYVGTLSKLLAPGLRVGWIAARQEFIDKLQLAKQPVDLCTNVFSQHLAYRYLKGDIVDRQIEKIKNLYRAKRDHMLDALQEFLPEKVDWTSPKGGMFIWLTLPEDIDAEEMFQDALDEGVAYVPGSIFYANSPKKNTLRLNFTFVDEKEITEGVKRLGRLIEEIIDRS